MVFGESGDDSMEVKGGYVQKKVKYIYRAYIIFTTIFFSFFCVLYVHRYTISNSWWFKCKKVVKQVNKADIKVEKVEQA